MFNFSVLITPEYRLGTIKNIYCHLIKTIEKDKTICS